VLRPETKTRARALQLLYAWELQGGASVPAVTTGLARLAGPNETAVVEGAEELAAGVVGALARVDQIAAAAAENWRLSRMAAVERNILRLGIYELERGTVPPKVAIDEAVRLARWFGGARAPAFVNGVLDRVARDMGRL